MRAILRSWVLLPLLLAALLLPRVNAVLLEVHPGITTAVICNGSELVTLRIGPDGTPIETETTRDGPCLLTDVTPVDPRSMAGWVALARSYAFGFVEVPSPLVRHDPALLNRRSQGPPRVV